MNNLIFTMRKLLFFQLLITFILGLSPNVVKGQNPLHPEKNLTKVLEKISEKYSVYFSYDAQQINSIQTPFQLVQEEPLAKALDRLLEPLDIKYEAIGDQFYVLEQQQSATNTKTLSALPTQKKTLEFQLLDQKDQSYIFNAFVFVRNSSIGTTSDLEGRIQLDIESLMDVEIVITHLNYETVSFLVNDQLKLPKTILLKDKSFGMNEILVKSKKGKPKNRKAWLKQFQKAFFGKYQKRNRLKLLNPEVLWFEEDNKTLTAHAVDHLSIVNEKLGYQMKFYLDTFNVKKNNDMVFAGKVFFEDIKATLSKPGKVSRLRKKTYANSPMLFFQNLYHQKLEHSKYEIGVASAMPDTDSLHYEGIKMKDIVLSKGQLYDTLFVNGHLTIIHKDDLQDFFQMRGNRIYRSNNLNVSFFQPQSGFFLFNKQGQLINQKEIVESGYWTDYRVASLIPIDYQSIMIDQSKQNKSLLLSNQLDQYKSKAGEKIYLQLNKPYYSNLENIWFKSYLVNAVDHTINTPSQVVYVDLISPKDSILRTWNLHSKTIMHGDFQFDTDHEAGLYRLRAYTEYMRNYDEAYFFEKLIPVYDNHPNSLNHNATFVNEKTTPSTSPINLNFYPEGGDLITGLSSKVAFQAMNNFGSPLEITGQIEDQNGALICKIKSIHQGIGLFNFTPTSNNKYKAILSYQSKTYSFDLPQHLPKGINLSVNNANPNQVIVQAASSDPTTLNSATIIGHVRGEIFCQLNAIEAGTLIKISRDIIPEGLAHFTLFDGQGQPQAERLIFNKESAKSKEKLVDINPVLTADTQQKITLQLNEDLIDQWVNTSVSVTDHNAIQYTKDGQNIHNYLLLNSDLVSPIPNPDYYFQEEGSKEKQYLLDLMLMTHGWRKFVWKDLLKEEEKTLAYSAELGYSISGHTTHKDSDKRVPSEIMLNSFNENMIFKKTTTDKEGNFNFDNLLATDSITYILQARINKKEEEEEDAWKVEGNRLVDFQLLEKRSPPIKPLSNYRLNDKTNIPLSPKLEEEYTQAREKEIAYKEAGWKIDLDEISVNAKKPNHSSNRPMDRNVKFYNLDQMDWVAPATQGRALLSVLTPRLKFGLAKNGGLTFFGTNDQGQPIDIGVEFYIDGIPTDMQVFLALSADDIRTIFITPGGIAVTTRPISRSMEKYMDSGILPIKHLGYSKARTFYQATPNAYSDTGMKSSTSAIYWNPNLKFDENGKAEINLPIARKDELFEIRMEGVTNEGQIINQQILLPAYEK